MELRQGHDLPLPCSVREPQPVAGAEGHTDLLRSARRRRERSDDGADHGAGHDPECGPGIRGGASGHSGDPSASRRSGTAAAYPAGVLEALPHPDRRGAGRPCVVSDGQAMARGVYPAGRPQLRAAGLKDDTPEPKRRGMIIYFNCFSINRWNDYNNNNIF